MHSHIGCFWMILLEGKISNVSSNNTQGAPGRISVMTNWPCCSSCLTNCNALWFWEHILTMLSLSLSLTFSTSMQIHNSCICSLHFSRVGFKISPQMIFSKCLSIYDTYRNWIGFRVGKSDFWKSISKAAAQGALNRFYPPCIVNAASDVLDG